jgi:hypothetical protein
MKPSTATPAPNLGLSLVMALLYSGLVATLVALHPGPPPAYPGAAIQSATIETSAAPLTEIASPGSLRLRMTLPYMPGNVPREADQEI